MTTQNQPHLSLAYHNPLTDPKSTSFRFRAFQMCEGVVDSEPWIRARRKLWHHYLDARDGLPDGSYQLKYLLVNGSDEWSVQEGPHSQASPSKQESWPKI